MIVPVPDGKKMEKMITGRGKVNYLEKNLQWHLVHHKSHTGPP
jgi:hypothetical protein